MKLKDLGIRTLFAIWAIPLGWFVINSTFNFTALLPTGISQHLKPIYPVYILNLFLIVAAQVEYNNMLAHKFNNNKFFLHLFWLLPALLLNLLKKPLFDFTTTLFVLFIIVAAETFFIGKGTHRWKRVSLSLSGTVFLYLAGNALFNLQGEEFSSLWKWSFTNGTLLNANIGFVLVFTTVFLSDTMAYFTGSLLGKHHFSELSPKKTVEGAVGGLAASTLFMTLAVIFFSKEHVPVFMGPLLGLIIGFSSQVGDLFVSSMKRYFDVKDASHLIPGHGGILDRFDSIFFAVPVVHVVVSIFNQVINTL